MKKLSYVIVIAVLSLMGTTAYAQEIEEVVQQEKVEIELSDLPEAVTKALAADFAEYKADKAYKKMQEEAEVFYVKVSKGEEKLTLLFNAEGKLIAQKKVKSTTTYQ